MKLTSPQAAELLGIKPDTLRQWRHYKAGPAYTKAHGRAWYEKSDVLMWIKETTVKVKAGYATKAYQKR